MSEETPEQTEGPRPGYVIVGPDGHAVPEQATDGADDGADDEADEARGLTDLVEQPAKVMRIGSMIRQLLEEVKAAPLDEAGRKRLAGVLHTSIDELKDGLAPELDDELEPAGRSPSTPGHADRVRAAHRPGPAGRLAGGPVPRHPDRDLRPADGRPRPARADAPRAAARRAAPGAGNGSGSAARPGRGPGRRPHRAERDVPVGRALRHAHDPAYQEAAQHRCEGSEDVQGRVAGAEAEHEGGDAGGEHLRQRVGDVDDAEVLGAVRVGRAAPG